MSTVDSLLVVQESFFLIYIHFFFHHYCYYSCAALEILPRAASRSPCLSSLKPKRLTEVVYRSVPRLQAHEGKKKRLKCKNVISSHLSRRRDTHFPWFNETSTQLGDSYPYILKKKSKFINRQVCNPAKFSHPYLRVHKINLVSFLRTHNQHVSGDSNSKVRVLFQK